METDLIMAESEKPARSKRKMGDRRRKDENASKKPSLKSNWPPIKPKKNLQLTRLKDNDLFTVQDFLTPAESKAFVKIAEAMGFAHQGSLGPTKGEAYRDNDRIAVDDPVLANAMWEAGLNKLFSDIKIRGKVAMGLNPNIRFYRLNNYELDANLARNMTLMPLISPAGLQLRYKVGQRFGRHIDESINFGDGKRTHYTLLIYLSGISSAKSKTDAKDFSLEPLVGGETVFYGSRNGVVAEVAPTEGMALLHIHGDKCMLHEARNVAKGVKYVLRSDVVFA